MNRKNKPKHINKKLIVMTSTFPRWKNDSVPTFVLDHCKELGPFFNEIVIIAPHHKGSKVYEKIEPNMRIRRVKYFYPESKQDVFYDGGSAEKVKLSPLYALKVMLYFINVSIFLWREAPPFRKGIYINPNWVIPQGLIASVFKIFRPSVPIILHARGTDVFTLNSKPVRVLKRFTLKKANIVFVNSNALKTACKDIFDRDYIIQPTGYDSTLFSPKKADQYRQNKTETLRIITVGRLIEAKGFMDIVEAVNALVGQGLRLRLSIAGDGPLKSKIKKFINENNLSKNIKLLGWIEYEKIAKIYQNSDLYIGAPKIQSNGWRESFGNVYTEAMACGTPVLVTTSAGASEIIENESNGFVFEPGDKEKMEYYIKMIYEKPEMCIKVGQAAVNTAKKYSKHATRDRYLEVIDAF